MMRALRKKMTIFLWITVGAFVALIFLQWGMDIGRRRFHGAPPGIVAEVGGRSVSYDHYRAFLNQFRRAELERLGVTRLNEAEEAAIEERAFNQLIGDLLWWEEIARRRIKVTDEEVLAFIRSNPPAQLLEDTTLFTDGKFDHDKYLLAISDPRNLRWLNAYEREIRATLPKQKLQMDLLSTVRLTDGELRIAYERSNQRVRVRYLFLNPEDYIEKISLTEEDISRYYEANRDDFLQPERVELSYALFEKTPSLEDELGVKQEIEELWRRVKEGEDFSELAREFSEDPATAKEGGDLGLFGRGEMVKPFEEACFSLKTGEVSPPVKTPFGWHLIKLEERKGAKVRARHILLRVFPSQHTLERIREMAENFLKDAISGGSIEQAAEAYGVKMSQTPLFSRQKDFIPGIGNSEKGADFAFEAERGKLSDVVDAPNAYVVLKVMERKEAGVPIFEEVQSEVEKALLKQRSRALALSGAKSVLQKVKEGERLEAAARRRSLQLHTPPAFAVGDYASEVPRETEFRGCCFALKEGQVSGVVETERGFYVIELLKREPVDEDALKEEIDQFSQTLLNEKQTRFLQDWFENLKAKAKPKDHRRQFR